MANSGFPTLEELQAQQNAMGPIDVAAALRGQAPSVPVSVPQAPLPQAFQTPPPIPPMNMAAALGGKSPVQAGPPAVELAKPGPTDQSAQLLSRVVSDQEEQRAVPEFPGIAGSSEAGQQGAEGTEQGMLGRNIAFPRLPFGYRGMAGEVMPEGENFLPWGGLEGKSQWQDTFVDKPKQLEDAIMQGAQAEENLWKAKGDFLKRQQESQQEQIAALRENQLARQAEVQAKQQQVEQAVTRYSNDLADRGQFWKDPTSILTVIGATLIAAGSRGDPGIGVRLMNQAVEADFKKRQDLANMHLGELRSNVAKYREIAGDKDLGDRMAFADSQRVAAMELERIGAQFQGPIAKAKAAAMSKELLRSYQIQMGQIHAAMIYNKPHMENPAVKRAYEAAGKATGGIGYSAFAKAPGVQGFPTIGSGPPTQVRGIGGIPLHPSQQEQMVNMLMPKMSPEERADIEKRAPGASRQLEAEQREITRRIWSISGGNMDTFNKKMEEFQRLAEADIKDIAKAAQPGLDKINGYRRLQNDISLMEVTAQRLKTTPDKLLGSGADSIFGRAFMSNYANTMDTLMKEDPDKASVYRREKQEIASTVARFRQLLAGQTNAYIKDTSGGAVSDGENTRLKEYLAQARGWDGIKDFAMDGSTRSQAQYDGAINTAAHPVSGTLYRIQYGVGTPILDRKGVAGSKKNQNVEKAIQTLKKGK